MKKAFLLILVVLLAVGISTAQTYRKGQGLSGIDKLGAHQNGGKGCVGCHAPHSGWAGNGGNNLANGNRDTVNAGNYALWGQDLGPLYGYTIQQGDLVNGATPFTTTFPANSQFIDEPELLTGAMTCLSCHDGNIAKGAMMTNYSYEQANSLLPSGLYGSYHIPTLLGNDGVTAAGNYYNDHPIGPQATLGAVRVASHLQADTCTYGPCFKPKTGDTQYQLFATHYGTPNITSNGHSSPVVIVTPTDPSTAYLVCTTCHTPHSMYVANANGDAPIDGVASGSYPSYFFIAAPYNMGSNPSPQQASSATQFCRQCHYSGAGGSNEASNINTVTTAF